MTNILQVGSLRRTHVILLHGKPCIKYLWAALSERMMPTPVAGSFGNIGPPVTGLVSFLLCVNLTDPSVNFWSVFHNSFMTRYTHYVCWDLVGD